MKCEEVDIDVTASPSRVVESVGTFGERKAFWREKDDEERKKRESLSSVEDYTQGVENSAFVGVETIDMLASTETEQLPLRPQRTPSPYEIERSKEAIFLDTDDPEAEEEIQLDDLVQYQYNTMRQKTKEEPMKSSPDRKVIFAVGSSREDESLDDEDISQSQSSVASTGKPPMQISRDIFNTEMVRSTEMTESAVSDKDTSQGSAGSAGASVTPASTVEKSEIEQSEKSPSELTFVVTDTRLEEVREAANTLVSEIESTVEEKLGIDPKVSAPSSVDITDEELLSTGDVSSPEPARSSKHHPQQQQSEKLGSGLQTEAGTPEAHTIISSSSGEFFTAPEDSALKSSSDEPSRPKSWDSSLLGQVSNNFPSSGSGGSEYQTALSAASAQSSSESYLGSLSSEASASETLVASQIDLGRDLLPEDGDDEEEEESIHAQQQQQHQQHLLEQQFYQQQQQQQSSPVPGTHYETPAQYSFSQQYSSTSEGEGESPRVTTTTVTTTRSVHCEVGQGEEPRSGTGLPVTLTSSTSGTTVCTQVETTYEARVRGDPELADDQEGNLLMLESTSPSDQMVNQGQQHQTRSARTHRRAESQSWSDSLLYGIEEKIEDEQLKDIIFQGEEEISDLFEREPSEEVDDPIERPITPEPIFSPDERQRMYYPGTSFDTSSTGKDNVDTDNEPEADIVEEFSGLTQGVPDYAMEQCLFERGMAAQRLEDIEEEGSLKNSPKSVQSMEIGAPSLPEMEDSRNGSTSVNSSTSNGNGNGNGERAGRPGSRESSSSLKEFESLESAVLEEFDRKDSEPLLSEIEEGHESQVSEESDETEMCGEVDPYDGDLDNDEKMMKMLTEKFEMVEDSPEITDIPEYAEENLDPMAFFTTTVMELRSPETTESSQIDDFLLRSELIGTTDADSSLEFRLESEKIKKLDTKMTSSGDSLDDVQGGKNLMEVSRDSLDFDMDLPPPEPAEASSALMTDSLLLALGQVQPRNELVESITRASHSSHSPMTDSLELQAGQALPQMTESADSLNGGNKSSDEKSSLQGAHGGPMLTSTDSLENGAAAEFPSASSTTTSTAADAAMWSSGGGSASTLVSSQEDLTLENQYPL